MLTTSASIPDCHLTCSEACGDSTLQMLLINGEHTFEACLADMIDRVARGTITYPAKINNLPINLNAYANLLDPRLLERYASRDLEHATLPDRRVHCKCECFIGVKLHRSTFADLTTIGQCPQYPEEDQIAATNDPAVIGPYGGYAHGWPGIAAYLIEDPVWGAELQEIAAEAERARFDRDFQVNAHAAHGQQLPPQEQTAENDAHIRKVIIALGGANEVGDQAGVPVHELVQHHAEAAGRMLERYRARWPRDEIPILDDPDYDEWRAWHLAFQMHMRTMEHQQSQRQRDMPERVGGVEGNEDEGDLNAVMEAVGAEDLEQPVDQPAGATPEPVGHYRIDENENRVCGQRPVPAVRNPRPRRRRADEYYYRFLGAGRGGGRRDNDEDDFANEG